THRTGVEARFAVVAERERAVRGATGDHDLPQAAPGILRKGYRLAGPNAARVRLRFRDVSLIGELPLLGHRRAQLLDHFPGSCLEEFVVNGRSVGIARLAIVRRL